MARNMHGLVQSGFAKLSLNTTMPEGIENVLFVDNDVVFLGDVCSAHGFFANMSSRAVFGMARKCQTCTRMTTPRMHIPLTAGKAGEDSQV